MIGRRLLFLQLPCISLKKAMKLKNSVYSLNCLVLTLKVSVSDPLLFQIHYAQRAT